jgi:hypothetical protein
LANADTLLYARRAALRGAHTYFALLPFSKLHEAPTPCRTQKRSSDDSGRREKEPFERPFSLSTHFTALRAGPVAAADEQSAAEQRRTDQLMHVIEKLSR